jgi:uncharacterized protein YbdZ (MbtH family)
MTSAEYREYFQVIANYNKCYCMWPMEVAVPPGWTSTGFVGSPDAALNQIAELWHAAIARADRADHHD